MAISCIQTSYKGPTLPTSGLNSLQQAKQCNFSSKEINSMKWIKLIPNKGGLIQVDISGHPPIPIGSKKIVGNLLFLAVF
jgi:hypothetical protein